MTTTRRGLFGLLAAMAGRLMLGDRARTEAAPTASTLTDGGQSWDTEQWTAERHVFVRGSSDGALVTWSEDSRIVINRRDEDGHWSRTYVIHDHGPIVLVGEDGPEVIGHAV